MPVLDGPAVLYEAADPSVLYSPVINCHPLKKNIRLNSEPFRTFKA
jgi:hypothetical protein